MTRGQRMDDLQKQFETIAKEYCSGCGGCAIVSNGAVTMESTKDGFIRPKLTGGTYEVERLLNVCPFSETVVNEDSIAENQFGSDLKYANAIGYYIKLYTGHVRVADYRKNGSSGGLGTWIGAKMLEDDLIDAVIHVKNSEGDDLFEYSISYNAFELQGGAKSKYYPVELSGVMQEVLKHDKKYLIVGIPCFIKAIRLLAENEPEIKKRIVYTLGLVCGHMKSKHFAYSMAWEMGVQPSKLSRIDFRVKETTLRSDNYMVECSDESGGVTRKTIKELFSNNWGEGFFKMPACEYCDDVMAETADITIGDAWLPEYVGDPLGTNLIIIRNKEVKALFERHIGELSIMETSEEKIIQSQSSGIRHRREGLSYRLFLKDKAKYWRPVKRVEATKRISSRRKKIYESRINLSKYSIETYLKASVENDYDIFQDLMKKELVNYRKLYKDMLIVRFIKKVKRRVNTCLGR